MTMALFPAFTRPVLQLLAFISAHIRPRQLTITNFSANIHAETVVFST